MIFLIKTIITIKYRVVEAEYFNLLYFFLFKFQCTKYGLLSISYLFTSILRINFNQKFKLKKQKFESIN